MPRIIGGSVGGRRLRVPRGLRTRPTSARVRQTLFDILGEHARGSRFLDLFAGAGGVGLEAFSRGAAHVTLVERDQGAFDAIQRNVSSLPGASDVVEALRRDDTQALACLAQRGQRFDIVFLDPPYASERYESILGEIESRKIAAESAIVVVEHYHKRQVPSRIGGLMRYRSVKVGDHCLSFYRRSH